MGLDPDGSYIVVVSGEENQPATASSRSIPGPGGSDIVQTPGGSEGGAYFEHTYNGTTYWLRYVTITSATDSDYGKVSDYDLLQEDSVDIVANLLNASVSILLDEIAEDLYIGTIASILGLDVTDFFSSYTETSFQEIHMYASSNWTRRFTQVYSEADEAWKQTFMIQYVDTLTSFGGQYIDSCSQYQIVDPEPKRNRIYSPRYFDYNWQTEYAIICFKTDKQYYDRMYKIEFSLNGEIVMTHLENF